MKNMTILKKFAGISVIVTLIVLIVSFFILNSQKNKLENEVVIQTINSLKSNTNAELNNKFNVGISNAVSIGNNASLKTALKENNREIGIRALSKLSTEMKQSTPFQNTKVHVHTKDNKSFIRSWKLDKHGDDLSSFRASVVKVNQDYKSVNTFEIGKAGLSVRSVIAIKDYDGSHLGSLEFIQGINSVARSFEKKNESFILLMDKKLAVADTSKSKIIDNKYVVSQKFLNADFYDDTKNINFNKLLSQKYYETDKYFYTYYEIKDFQDKVLGMALVGKDINLVNSSIEKASSIIFNSLVLLVIGLLVTMVISILNLKSSVITPVLDLKNSILNLTNNNSSENGLAKITSKNNDEIGDVVNSFNSYLDYLEEGLLKDQKVIEETRTIIEKVNYGLLNDRVKLEGQSDSINQLVSEVNNMITVLQNNMTTLSDVFVQLSNAKYDYKIPDIKLSGLLASIFSGTKVTQSTINEVMCLIDSANAKLITSSTELATASTELSTSSSKQAASLEETAAAIEEISATIIQSAENAAEMSVLAKNVSQSNDEGRRLANETTSSMEELSSQVTSINDAISVIDNIAFQTNILSLNAAVEAATAGEAGKGFAVVAQEVRNLAQRSAEAAKEIKALVETANVKAQNGKEISLKMISGYEVLDNNISSTIKIIDSVASAAKEQQAAMEQITDTVNTLDQATQRNASLAESISNMSHVTSDLSHQLQSAINSTSFDKNAVNRICDEELIFTANKLKSDHISFKNVNFSKCEAGTKFTVTNHNECNLGKWINQNEGTSLSQTPSWSKLKEAHLNVHKYVQNTVDLYSINSGNKEIFDTTDIIEHNINEVFDLLNKIREENCKTLNK